eukprot:534446-Amphidinium_carterae.2
MVSLPSTKGRYRQCVRAVLAASLNQQVAGSSPGHDPDRGDSSELRADSSELRLTPESSELTPVSSEATPVSSGLTPVSSGATPVTPVSSES